MPDEERHDHDPPAYEEPAPQELPPITSGTTSLSRGWVIKSVVVALVFMGLGCWGLVDALVIYRNRGELFIDFVQRDYLQLMASDGRTRSNEVSIEDPAAELIRLENMSGVEGRNAVVSEWLTAISRLESLEGVTRENEAWLAARAAGESPEDTRTMFLDPAATLARLTEELSGKDQPKRLAQWDIPSQWLFVVVGFGGGIPLLLSFFIHASKKYRYDADTRTLTMPSGDTVTPATLTGFDKRKWDKFLVFITLKDESDERKIDLYRYVPLERWLVDIYEHSDVYEPDDEADDAPDEDEDIIEHREGGDG